MVDWNSILIVSPEQRTLEAISNHLTADGFKVVRAASEAEVNYCLQRTTSFAGAIIDLTYGERWLALLEQVANRLAIKPLLALAPQTDLRLVTQALQRGAFDYLLKPVLPEEVSSALITILGRSFHQEIAAGRRNGWQRERTLQPVDSLHSGMREKMQIAGILARTDAPLLLVGEPGVGKTFFSRVIHFLSLRRFEPLTFIDCRNRTSGELLLELFGSGCGILNHQQNGTIVFKDCFSLSISVQNRIVAFWEEMEQSAPGRSSVRLLGTTRWLPEHKDFRGDASLPFRQMISSAMIDLPSLTERKEDIPSLADIFLQEFSNQYAVERKYLSSSAVQKLMQSDWPDNLRQLQQTCIRAAALCEGTEINAADIRHLTATAEGSGLQMELPSMQLEQVEETLIGQALHYHSGNMSRTATTLGISRGTLYNKIRKYGLENLTKKNDITVQMEEEK